MSVNDPKPTSAAEFAVTTTRPCDILCVVQSFIGGCRSKQCDSPERSPGPRPDWPTWSAAPKIFSYPQARRPITPSFGGKADIDHPLLMRSRFYEYTP